ncbi:MAG: hypothetical protein EU550_00850 [Promethearchaeota archaeon]|nr:MAG: hypothetical protein EU550_00850 [Candidatus Lokiarchaeota archaeon]
MLEIKITQNGKTRIERIFVIDAHSHLGQDVDGATMMNPLAPGSGTFDFWSRVEGKIVESWQQNQNQSYSTILNGISTKLEFNFTRFPFTEKLINSLHELGNKHSDLKEKLQFNSFIDQATVFPFQDVFRDKYPDALYHASNLNIARFTKRFPFSLKLIGYCRVDPTEGEKAINEVKFSREKLGLRGLKLHPRSEGWVDKTATEVPIKVLLEAAKYSMPIIFDTRGKRTIIDIGKLVGKTRDVMKRKYPELLPHFKVIIAHFAQGNVGDYDVYNTIVQPSTYGDLSMLHGKGAKNFFTDFQQWFKNHDKINVDGRDWSEYLLFATDYPYFGEIHAQKLLINMFSKDFFENGGKILDIKNILGLNQIKLLPEYNHLDVTTQEKKNKRFIVSNISEREKNSHKMILEGIAELLANNQIDIEDFYLKFKSDWKEIQNNLYLKLQKPNSDQKFQVLILNIVENLITLFTVLPEGSKRKIFEYNYFNIDDNQDLKSLLNQSYILTQQKEVSDTMKQFFI